MKTSRLPIALLAVLFSGLAHAQSSVTLYGFVEDGLNYTNNAGSGSTYKMLNGVSGFGLTGTEDLGGGIKTLMKLENGVDVNNGTLQQGNREFGRQAYVGLTSPNLGTLTLGRQYDPTQDMFSIYTGAYKVGGNMASHPFDNDNADWDFRVNNAVKYVSPTLYGLTGEAMYAFSNNANFANNRLYSAAGQYVNGGFQLAVAYLKKNNPNTGSGAISGDGVFTSKSEQNIDAAASYKFGELLLQFAYSHVDVYDPTANAYFYTGLTQPAGGTWSAWKFDNFELNSTYFFTPALFWATSYTYTLGHLTATNASYKPAWHQITTTLDYSLSKQTTVYVQAAFQHVQSAHTGTDFDFAQTPASGGISSSANQFVARVAITHSF